GFCISKVNEAHPYYALTSILGNSYTQRPGLRCVDLTVSVKWKDNSRSDVLLIPRDYCNYPTILMEVQQIVPEAFLQRVIRYCLNICKKYGRKPLVVIFGVTGEQSQSFQGTFHPTRKQYIHSASCTF
ncbi:hypothetical protein CLU79DRAFT_881259, partial [Phycomyces nitens]